MRKIALLFLCLSILAIHQNIFGLNVHSTEETLNKIMEIISNQQKGAYLRFGDGDVILATGGFDSYQEHNSTLETEMREVFALNDPNILKCLPLGCRELGGFEEGMYDGNHEVSFEFCMNMLHRAVPLWGGKMDDVYSPNALAYTAVSKPDACIQFLKFLRQSPCSVLVGNRNIPTDVRELLFGTQCHFVATPSQNSYDEIDRIERECLEKMQGIDGYKIIITSMGCSGRALQKRLWNKLDTVFLFDFGSLMDALCGWDTRAWISLNHSHFNNQRFLHKLEDELNRPSKPTSQNATIKVLYTAALLSHAYEMRQDEYMRSLEILKKYGYDAYIVEACELSGPTFFDEHCSHVLYTKVNDLRLRNKGVNEATSMIEGFKYYDFADDDMIVKITGRYHFHDRDFLNIVENHPEMDAIVKYDHLQPPNGRIFTGCFAMRAKLFKEMLQNLDLKKMEDQMIDIEYEVANYIAELEKRKLPVMRVGRLSLTANIGGYSPPNLTYW